MSKKTKILVSASWLFLIAVICVLVYNLHESNKWNDTYFRQMMKADDELAETRNKLAEVLRNFDEVSGNLTVRSVKVNRDRSPQEALNATGYKKKYTNEDIINTMPRGDGEKVDVFFFKLGREVSNEEIENEYKIRGLKPADPYSLAAVNEQDPDFAQKKPNATYWKDSNGRWCCAIFCQRVTGECDVDVYYRRYKWIDVYWFAGVSCK